MHMQAMSAGCMRGAQVHRQARCARIKHVVHRVTNNTVHVVHKVTFGFSKVREASVNTREGFQNVSGYVHEGSRTFHQQPRKKFEKIREHFEKNSRRLLEGFERSSGNVREILSQ